MRQTTSEAYLLQTYAWFKQRNASGPGSWAAQERDMLQSLQNSGDPFVNSIAQGTPLFNTLAWAPRIDPRERAARRHQAAQNYRDPFEDLLSFGANVSQIPAPLDPGANPGASPSLGAGLNAGLQTHPPSTPVVGAPMPVSSNSVAPANAPEFMNPDPRLQVTRPPPEAGSVSELNPSSVPDVPEVIPPPPGGPIPPPPPPGMPGVVSNLAAERRAATGIINMLRNILEDLKPDGAQPSERPPEPSVSRSGFPEALGALAQVLALRLREYKKPEFEAGFAQFQTLIQRLKLRFAYEGPDPFQQHLSVLKFRINSMFNNVNLEKYKNILRLPFDGVVAPLYPFLAVELIDTVNGIRETLAEAEILLVSWSAPVSEQNFLDLARQYGKQIESSQQILIKLFACSEQLRDSIVATSLLPVPALEDLAAAYKVYEPRATGTKGSVARELKLWQAILDRTVRTPGVDYSLGLDNPLLQEWIIYEPLSSRYASLSEALVRQFGSAESSAEPIREFVANLASEANSLQAGLLSQLVDRFYAINAMAVELFNRAASNAAGTEQATVGFAAEAAVLQARTFVLLSAASDKFRSEDNSNPSAQKTLNTKFKEIWNGVVNKPGESPASMRSLSNIFNHPDFKDLLPENFGKKTTIAVKNEWSEIANHLAALKKIAPPQYDGGLAWHNSCEDCGLAGALFCKTCANPFCTNCFETHEEHDEKYEVSCDMLTLKRTGMCKLQIPPHVGQVVLDDQAITVGEKVGQLLGFEYACLQATQLQENAHLFHLMTLECGPQTRISIRYLRVTVHSVLPIAEDDPIRILINGAAVSEAKLYYGQSDGRAPQLRGRSVLVPEGAEISWLRETDQAWLHGSVANIELPEGTPVNVRLQLPTQLQSQGVLTKDVTASVEIVLTETPQ